MLEKLEARTLFDITPAASLAPILQPWETEDFYHDVASRFLRVNGTDGADTIDVLDSGAYFSVSRNGTVRLYSKASVSSQAPPKPSSRKIVSGNCC